MENTLSLSNKKLSPNYLAIDYDTYKQRITNVLKRTTTFTDFNFEGSNLAVITELLAYQNELNTYYLNKLAGEQFSDTAVLYENVHRIAGMQGYEAKGFTAAKAIVTVRIPRFVRQAGESLFDFGDVIYVPYGTRFLATAYNVNTKVNDQFIFVASKSIQVTVPQYSDNEDNVEFSFNVPVIQGEPIQYEYSFSDLVDWKLNLPFQQFDHSGSMSLTVNDEFWTPVDSFYSDMSNLSELSQRKVFRFLFNKYKKYIIEFSPTFSVPAETDSIKVRLIKTIGAAGNVGAGLINSYVDKTIWNSTRQTALPTQYISCSNDEPAAGGADAQTQTDVLLGGKAAVNGQERCVTKKDYKYFLEARADVNAAAVWGEQEVSKSGDVREYNKIHVSIVPNLFGPETIQGDYEIWNTDVKSGPIYKASKYYDGFIQDLKNYLEPRKFITTYEQFDVPELIYFSFHFTLRLSSYYSFLDVSKQLLDKLRWYFLTTNRAFNETISFMELHNWLLDSSIIGDSEWPLLAGIQNLVFRNIWISSSKIPEWKRIFYALPKEGGEYKDGDGVSHTVSYGYDVKIPEDANVYPPNFEPFDYPQYTSSDYMYAVDNRLKVIKLGHAQFPVLAQDLCVIDQAI